MQAHYSEALSENKSAIEIRRPRWNPPRPLVAQSAKDQGLPPHWNFRLLLIGETTSKLGASVTSVLLPLIAVTTLHASPFVVGLLTAAPWLPWLVIGLPAGAWVDRLAPRRVMLVCNAVSAVLFASVPAAWWLGALTIWQVLGGPAVGGRLRLLLLRLLGVPSLAGRPGGPDGSQRETAGRGAGRQGRWPRSRRVDRPDRGQHPALLVDAASWCRRSASRPSVPAESAASEVPGG
ncbi:MFS transporter [Streptomyces sp. CRPSP2-6A1]|uniref:MFS transporter n=1 Tax=Streptomyces sp. CRPSP2-6A1 TaxID=2799588 RepID=UPI0035ABC260